MALSEENFRRILAILATVLAGVVGGAGYRVIDDPRDNPFSSLDADAMEKRIIARIEREFEELRRDQDSINERLLYLERRRLVDDGNK